MCIERVPPVPGVGFDSMRHMWCIIHRVCHKLCHKLCHSVCHMVYDLMCVDDVY